MKTAPKSPARPNILRCLVAPLIAFFKNPLVIIPPAVFGVLAALVFANNEILPANFAPLVGDPLLFSATNKVIPFFLIAVMLPLFVGSAIAPVKMLHARKRFSTGELVGESFRLSLEAYRVFQLLTITLFPLVLMVLAGFAFLSFFHFTYSTPWAHLWQQIGGGIVIALLVSLGSLRVVITSALTLGQFSDVEQVNHDSKAIMSRGFVALAVILLASILIGFFAFGLVRSTSYPLFWPVEGLGAAACLWYCVGTLSSFSFNFVELLKTSRAETVRRLSSSTNIKNLVKELVQEEPKARSILMSESDRSTVKISRNQANSISPKKKEVPDWSS